MHRAAHDLAVLGEYDLYVGLLDDGRVEVADEDSGVERARIILVGHVAGLGFTSHPPPGALLGDTEMEDRTLQMGQTNDLMFGNQCKNVVTLNQLDLGTENK